MPFEAARVRVQMGVACREIGDVEAGQLEFDAARATFERLGARAELARLRGLRGHPAGAGPLSARELQVLRMVAEGRTNKAIARALELSERTVDRHVSSILGKLQVPSRAAATAHAISRRLIESPGGNYPDAPSSG
jgi:DNA-binding NarL/FixJ family response regulator